MTSIALSRSAIVASTCGRNASASVGNRLQPHRSRTVKKSNGPAFTTKAEDVAGVYMNPLAHDVVVPIDDKTQIQALDCTQPGLPLKPGKCGTMTQ